MPNRRWEAVVVVVVVEPAAAPAPPPRPGWERLTERERTVARLAGQALTNQQISRRLGITTHTVNFHLRQIFTKLSIGSRVSLARLADPPSGGAP